MVATTKFSRQTVNGALIAANSITTSSAPLPAILSPINFSGLNPDNDNLPYALTFPFGPINLRYESVRSSNSSDTSPTTQTSFI